MLKDIIMAVIPVLITIAGIVIKKMYIKLENDKKTKEIIDTVVEATEQMYQNEKGTEKLKAATESAIKMLKAKNIEVSDDELRLLIEASVGAFNDIFKRE